MQTLQNGQIGTILLNSGKGLNDMGNYDGCNASPTTKYVTGYLSPGSASPIFIYIGLCLPLECDATELKALSEMLTQLIKE